jgi:cellobiose phosphorylase
MRSCKVINQFAKDGVGCIFHLIQAILGLRAAAPNGRLYVDPTLPNWLPEIELKNFTVGDSILHLRFWKERSESCRGNREPSRLY